MTDVLGKITEDHGVLSAMSANSLFWLGRYEQRVYMTLHQMHRCYDELIDDSHEGCAVFCKRTFTTLPSYTLEEFMKHLVYDEDNPSSLISAQLRARDNAMLLRELIRSETLSYLEMGVALMRQNREKGDYRISSLQPITDWSLAFFTSAMQRIYNSQVNALILVGRCVENIDMMLRFEYPTYKLEAALAGLKLFSQLITESIDTHIIADIEQTINAAPPEGPSAEDRLKLTSLINVVVRV